MPDPDLSIVVATWNSRDIALRCLHSIFESATSLSLEVILVVNGSRDGTQAAVKQLFGQVVLIDNGENLGFSKANNIGIGGARGPYVLLLNDDTIVTPGALEQMHAYLTAHTDTAAVGPQLLNMDESKQNCIHNTPTLLTEIVPSFLFPILFPRSFPSRRQRFDGPVHVQAILGACMMIRREAIDKVGLLDERFFSYLEETDWLLRMRQAGYRIVHIPTARVYHVMGSSSKKRFPGPSRVEYYRSLYLFFQKHYSPSVYRGFLVLKLAKLLMGVLFLSLASLGTGFRIRRMKVRMRSYAYLLAWHLKGRPDGMGLQGHPGESR